MKNFVLRKSPEILCNSPTPIKTKTMKPEIMAYVLKLHY